MSLDEQAALIVAFNTAEKRVRAHLVAYVLGLFGGLGSWRDRDKARFAAQVTPVVAGAQRQVASLMDAYLARLLSDMRGRPARPAGAIPDVSRLRGVDPAIVYGRPFDTVWAELAEGRDFEQALAAGRLRAEQITKTDLQLAETHTARALLEDDRDVVGYRRVLTGTTSCGLCVVASTQRYHRGELLPIHPGCVPEGTPVAARDVLAVTRRKYAGELSVIRTTSGDEVTVTANHPVLTDQGWIPGHVVREGDYVVRSAGGHRMVGRGPQESDRPVLAEDVWRSASVAGLVQVPLAAEDFHGDGADGEVEIVRTDRHLAPVGDVSFGQPLGESLLVDGHGRGRLLSPGGYAAPFIPGGLTASRSIMGSAGLSGALLGGHLSSAHEARLGAVATGNLAVLEKAGDGVSLDSVLLGQREFGQAVEVALNDLIGRQLAPRPTSARFDPPAAEFTGEGRRAYAVLGRRLLDRLAGQVELDRVVEVRRVDYSGHVYNLHTAEGWYSANSHIISNCDCGIAPILGDTDPGHVINAPLLEDVHDRIQERFGVSDRSGRKPIDYRDLLVTHQHGEIGPVIAVRGQSWTGPADVSRNA